SCGTRIRELWRRRRSGWSATGGRRCRFGLIRRGRGLWGSGRPRAGGGRGGGGVWLRGRGRGRGGGGRRRRWRGRRGGRGRGAGGADVTAKVAAMVARGQTDIPADNGSYGDPAYLHVKRLRVEYKLNGKAQSGVVEENGTLQLFADGGPSAPAPFVVEATPKG